MKRLFLSTCFILALLTTGCQHDPVPRTATKEKELEDPELTVDGVPTSAIESGATFTITVTSKSDGKVKVSVDKPAVAIAKAKGDNQFEISAVSSLDTDVKLTVAQDQVPRKFKNVSVSATFKVKGTGAIALPGPSDEIAGTEVTFEEASGDVVSPERGLYHAHEMHSSTEPISGASVKALRATGHTLWLLEFYLTDFMTSSISNTYLDKMQECFDAIREGGVKAIVRFAYRNNNNNSNEDKEPDVHQTLAHVEQVTPILRQNEDILFCLQAGFIGTWGEWYYTSHFSSMSDRKKLTDALLASVPVSRQIQLRTPAFKMSMYNLALKDTITAKTAHDGSLVSRLAGHNDCFGADKNDEGTFADETTRKFWQADTRYAIMGGETCKVSDYCLCPQTLKDLEDYHWTYLHDGYNMEVLNRWKTDGCFAEIQSRLGYRLVLSDVHYEAIEAGKRCKVTIRMENKGFAAPMNPREAWLVWVTPDGKKEKSFLGADARTWQPGYNAVVSYFTPSTAKGTLYLELPDPLIPDDPNYSIALANKNMFDASTGYNKLFEVK